MCITYTIQTQRQWRRRRGQSHRAPNAATMTPRRRHRHGLRNHLHRKPPPQPQVDSALLLFIYFCIPTAETGFGTHCIGHTRHKNGAGAFSEYIYNNNMMLLLVSVQCTGVYSDG